MVCSLGLGVELSWCLEKDSTDSIAFSCFFLRVLCVNVQVLDVIIFLF